MGEGVVPPAVPAGKQEARTEAKPLHHTAQTDEAAALRRFSHLSPTFYAEGPERVSDSPSVTQHLVPEANWTQTARPGHLVWHHSSLTSTILGSRSTSLRLQRMEVITACLLAANFPCGVGLTATQLLPPPPYGVCNSFSMFRR